ncbi:2-hydroxyisoflavanone dehydratase [Glycine soja]|uniref:2-hydroxyisoflavanone dehydratase n=1 Tax=Glycine soja TaxID=3848 RepID=A0A445JWH6_GLYSO|nr:2-hydroxyisoflavanone dehydratase [Glycine soja]
MGTLIRIFSDGTIERPLQTPFVPLKLDEPHTGLSSKDVVISHNLPVSALVYLPKLTNEADKVPILVYFHGGGFVIESAFSQRYHNFFKTFVPQVGLTGLGCSRMIACVAGKDSLRERGVSYYESVKKSGWQGKLEFFEEKDEGHVYQLFNVEGKEKVVDSYTSQVAF